MSLLGFGKSQKSDEPDSQFDLAPSLLLAIAKEGLDPQKLKLAVPPIESELRKIEGRHSIHLWDGQKFAVWEVVSLRALFRGDKKAPEDMSHYPEEYALLFWQIEQNALLANNMVSPAEIRDEDFEKIYSTMRRLPDGRSLGVTHDIIWQAACLALGLYPVSQDEFDAIFRQLARSARHFKTHLSSCNYIHYLQETFV